LLKTDLVTVENSLFETKTDVSEQVQDRATAGDILDALNWLPSDLFQFIQIIDSQDDTRFWVSKYPITNYQYRRFLYSKDYTSKEYWSNFYTYCKSGDLENFEDEWRAIEIEQDELHSDVQRGFPVTGISWYAANAYSKWLLTHWNEIPESQTNPQLQPQTLRLPTEHEWILAAGGKSNGRFPWEYNIKIRATRDIYDRANIGILKRKTSVCMFPSGKSFPFGLLDMAGNVWEWTQTTDHTRKFIITKGGSFVSQLWCGKVGSKEMHNPAVKSENIGFRIILFE
jgi:formylglycine-generating enzyme required for sulfatase activity